MPKVSVIVPVYNVEKYISRCIESVQAQTLSDWELILIDDAGTDKSMDIVKLYASNDDRIKYVESKSNVGPMMARKKGYEIAKSEYIVFADSDDYMPSTALGFLYEKAVDSKADIVCGGNLVLKLDGTQIKRIPQLEGVKNGEDLLEALLRKKVQHVLWGKLFKKELLLKHQYVYIDKMTNAEDAYLFYQITAFVQNVEMTDEIVYHYIKTEGSSTVKRLSENALDNILLFQSLKVSLVERYPDLKKLILSNVTSEIIDLFYQGYDEQGVLTELLKKRSLIKFCKIKEIVNDNDLNNAIRLIAKLLYSQMTNILI